MTLFFDLSQRFKLFTKISGLSISDEFGSGDETVVRFARRVIAASRTGVKINITTWTRGSKRDFQSRVAEHFFALPANHLLPCPGGFGGKFGDL